MERLLRPRRFDRLLSRCAYCHLFGAGLNNGQRIKNGEFPKAADTWKSPGGRAFSMRSRPSVCVRHSRRRDRGPRKCIIFGVGRCSTTWISSSDAGERFLCFFTREYGKIFPRQKSQKLSRNLLPSFSIDIANRFMGLGIILTILRFNLKFV